MGYRERGFCLKALYDIIPLTSFSLLFTPWRFFLLTKFYHFWKKTPLFFTLYI